jgi:hypothetical protein
MMRLVRLLKLVRVLKLGKFLGKYEDMLQINPAIIRVLKLLVAMGVVAHFMACAFFGITNFYDTETVSWPEAYCEPSGDPREVCASEVSPASQYLMTLYWSFTTVTSVGYGDITPRENGEMLMAVLTMLVGTCVFAHVISGIMHLILNIDPGGRVFKNRVNELREYLSELGLSKSLRRRVKRHYEFHLTVKSVFDESQLLCDLPWTLRRDVIAFVYRDFIGAIPLIRRIEDKFHGFIVAAAQLLPPVFVSPGEHVCEVGDAIRSLYIVHTGDCREIETSSDRKPRSYRPGEYFGAMAGGWVGMNRWEGRREWCVG